MCALSPTCFSVSAPRAMVSTPANAPIGFDPYGPGLPRSASSQRNVPRTPVASLFDQPALPAAFVLRQSSLVTRSPLAGAVPVNPSERASSTPPPNDHCPVEPAPPARRVPCVLAAAFDRGRAGRRSTLSCRHLHDAADGIAAEQRALRPAHDLHLRDVAERQQREVEAAAEGVRADAVHEHERVVRLAAAREHRRQRAASTAA